MKLYHVSKTPNLTVLKPRISTHGKAYVYATESLALALLFGSSSSWGDFDGICGINQDNKIPHFYEAYEGAFKRAFANQQCYIYEVDPSTFESGKTSFSGEVVSSKPVKVLNCTKVNDLYGCLIALGLDSKIDIYEYENTEKYKRMIDKHIEDRIIRFNVLKNKRGAYYKMCCEKFPHIIEKLENEKSLKR